MGMNETKIKKKNCECCGILFRDDRRKHCSIWCRNHVDEPLAPFTIPDETQTVPIGYNYKTKVLLWG